MGSRTEPIIEQISARDVCMNIIAGRKVFGANIRFPSLVDLTSVPVKDIVIYTRNDEYVFFVVKDADVVPSFIFTLAKKVKDVAAVEGCKA